MTESKDVTCCDERMVKRGSGPNHIEFELEDEEPILNDPRKDGEITDSVETDNKMSDKERQVRDIRHGSYIGNGTANDMPRSDHDGSRKDVGWGSKGGRHHIMLSILGLRFSTCTSCDIDLI